MMDDILELKNIKDWKKFKKKLSDGCESIIFKFSPICPISESVGTDFFEWYNGLPEDKKIKCVRINVIDSGDVSRKIAHDLYIMHQSPQIIWLDENGKVKWEASHSDINKKSLSEHLSSVEN
jgi:monothiol bacilliredoxin